MIDFLAEGGCSLVEYSKQGLIMLSLSKQNQKMIFHFLRNDFKSPFEWSGHLTMNTFSLSIIYTFTIKMFEEELKV